ncbi:hypothetical protein E2C01_000092 [Portunus trituberculatus]|uniref:Uncharacterized protein n=1 Tax=Portunus trituberculatus TaxID=210409 RepID=A0A5B7CE87_PORTR|nr:hypothetical protein [Portunus trituberculatus]
MGTPARPHNAPPGCCVPPRPRSPPSQAPLAPQATMPMRSRAPRHLQTRQPLVPTATISSPPRPRQRPSPRAINLASAFASPADSAGPPDPGCLGLGRRPRPATRLPVPQRRSGMTSFTPLSLPSPSLSSPPSASLSRQEGRPRPPVSGVCAILYKTLPCRGRPSGRTGGSRWRPEGRAGGRHARAKCNSMAAGVVCGPPRQEPRCPLGRPK